MPPNRYIALMTLTSEVIQQSKEPAGRQKERNGERKEEQIHRRNLLLESHSWREASIMT